MDANALTFRAYDAGDGTTDDWVVDAHAAWPHLIQALNQDAGVTDDVARKFFAEHMPELAPVLERLASAVDRPQAATLLSHLALKSPFSGCTQSVIDGVLLRNYDFEARFCDRTFVRSNFLRPVIGSNDVLWGLLDGMNDAGLAVSLTYGGRPAHGPGPTILLVVRYLLETCATVAEAWRVLCRLPIATVQNLTLVDGSEALTVHIGPDRQPARAAEVCVTNHQDAPVTPEQERESTTGERLAAIRAATARAASREPADRIGAVADALLSPPLYKPFNGSFGTLYTAVYRPAEGRASYLWPGDRIDQSFAEFTPGAREVKMDVKVDSGPH
jgi:predicted choloylglycine hydrolase